MKYEEARELESALYDLTGWFVDIRCNILRLGDRLDVKTRNALKSVDSLEINYSALVNACEDVINDEGYDLKDINKYIAKKLHPDTTGGDSEMLSKWSEIVKYLKEQEEREIKDGK